MISIGKEEFSTIMFVSTFICRVLPAIIEQRVSPLEEDSCDSDNVVDVDRFSYVTRRNWHARNATGTEHLHIPVPYVVIHHTYIPGACSTMEECSEAMRSMQNYHMDDQKWCDIGYNFCVGGDGAVYEGRGWTAIGAHSLHFNTVSVGICLIGDFSYEVPPVKQLETTTALIAVGLKQGYIQPDYKLVGHRQVRSTECPGEALFNVIKSWDHWSSFPSSYKDLDKISELSKH